jgi:hypothetical protein
MLTLYAQLQFHYVAQFKHRDAVSDLPVVNEYLGPRIRI